MQQNSKSMKLGKYTGRKAASLGVERFVMDDGWFGERTTTMQVSVTGM